MKRTNSIVLMIGLLICIFTVFLVPANAQDDPNVATICETDDIVIDDNLTIQITTQSMTVSSFTCGLKFDPTLVRVTAVTVSAITTPEGEPWEPIVASTPEQANQTGTVGFAYAYSGDRTYAPGTVAEITFEAIGEGIATFTLYEDSDGATGNRSDSVQILTCQISDDSSTETDDPLVHKDKNHDHICDECGQTIGECMDADANNRCDICGKFISLLGDVNMDGEIDVFDANLVVSYFYGSVDLTDVQIACADVNGDGEVDVFDANLIVSHFYGSIDYFPADQP